MAVALAIILSFPTLTAFAQESEAAPERGNWLTSVATPLEVTEVLAQTSDPAAANFEEEFTFYRVTFAEPVTFDTWVYREPARGFGETNFVLELDGTLTWDRFWFGVSAPDQDGIQHEIVHQGQVNQYFILGDQVWSLKAQFDGQGNLLHVNGVTPVVEE